MKYNFARIISIVGASVATSFLLSSCGAGDGETSTDIAADRQSLIQIEDAWVRATVGSNDPSMTAGFMTIYNEGTSDIELTGAESEVAAMTELHEMAVVENQMVMREVESGITISAGRGKDLSPGGYHVMLMGLSGDLAPGDEVELTLKFSDGSERIVTAPVKEFTEEEGHYHEPGTGAHSHEDEVEAGSDS